MTVCITSQRQAADSSAEHKHVMSTWRSLWFLMRIKKACFYMVLLLNYLRESFLYPKTENIYTWMSPWPTNSVAAEVIEEDRILPHSHHPLWSSAVPAEAWLSASGNTPSGPICISNKPDCLLKSKMVPDLSRFSRMLCTAYHSVKHTHTHTTYK